ncbi:MAG TPA: hypothetical protein VMF69_01665, partial [Gemmataceae bacterium]|nr:hypothetical protein [Gemmataceae bacterium]
MATSETISRLDKLARAWDYLLAGRPLLGLVVVLCITTGHAMNFREMSVSQGWVPAVFYILQSSFLASLALTLLVCPALGQRLSCRSATQLGLVLVTAGSFLNGLAMWSPFSIFVTGRIVVAVGAGMVIYFTPRLLEARWQPLVTWTMILCPVAGPGVIAAFTMSHDVSDWEWAFLFEGVSALAGLLLLLTMAQTRQSRPSPPRGSLAYLPSLVLAAAALVYCQHWGQLQGWMESLDIVIMSSVGIAALTVSLWLAWPQLDFSALSENWIRLVVFSFGGVCQFFHGYTMNTYGGALVNFSSWQRAWLIWPMPIGIAASLALPRLPWRRPLRLGLPGAVAGLLLLTGGLYLCYQQTMDWPSWQILDMRGLNWFAAPTHWELAPGRFLMGLGVGLFMFAVEKLASPDAQREQEVQPFFPVVQFFGGMLATGIFVNFLLIGQQVHYSYSADRGYIQADELARRQTDLRDDFRRQGRSDPERATEVLLYR